MIRSCRFVKPLFTMFAVGTVLVAGVGVTYRWPWYEKEEELVAYDGTADRGAEDVLPILRTRMVCDLIEKEIRVLKMSLRTYHHTSP